MEFVVSERQCKLCVNNMNSRNRRSSIIFRCECIPNMVCLNFIINTIIILHFSNELAHSVLHVAAKRALAECLHLVTVDGDGSGGGSMRRRGFPLHGSVNCMGASCRPASVPLPSDLQLLINRSSRRKGPSL